MADTHATTSADPRWIEYRRPEDLPTDPKNPKGHAGQFISTSIAGQGVIEPQVLDERTLQLISGHGRRESYLELETRWRESQTTDEPMALPDGVVLDSDGRWTVPVVRGWGSKDDAHAQAALVGLNRGVELGGWLRDPLGVILVELRDLELPALELTGFVPDDLASILPPIEPPVSPPVDDSSPLNAPERVSYGEIWSLGRHRLLCGDSRDLEHVKALLDGATINLAVTSPPYAEQRDYDDDSEFEPIPPDEYVAWFEAVAANVAEHLALDGSWCVNIKPPGINLDTHLYVHDLVAAHVREWGWHFATEFCWERNGVPKQPALRLKNGFEPVYQFARGRWKFRPDAVRHATDNAIESLGPGSGNTSWKTRQGKSGVIPEARKQAAKDRKSNAARQGDPSDEWFNHRHVEGLAYPSNRLPTFLGSHEATGHPAAYPVGLPAFFARLLTDRDDVLYDPFCGSGSTLLAAELEGRRGYGVEISPKYCDIIVARWEKTYPDQPVSMVGCLDGE